MKYKIKAKYDFIVINQDLNNLTIEQKDIPSLIYELQLILDASREMKLSDLTQSLEIARINSEAL